MAVRCGVCCVVVVVVVVVVVCCCLLLFVVVSYLVHMLVYNRSYSPMSCLMSLGWHTHTSMALDYTLLSQNWSYTSRCQRSEECHTYIDQQSLTPSSTHTDTHTQHQAQATMIMHTYRIKHKRDVARMMATAAEASVRVCCLTDHTRASTWDCDTAVRIATCHSTEHADTHTVRLAHAHDADAQLAR